MKSLKAHDLFLDAYNYAKQKNDPELINFKTGLLLAEMHENQKILSESMDQLLNDKN